MENSLKEVKYCNSCGKELKEISTKTAEYKGVCLSCEITYRVDNGVLIRKSSTPHQLTEAVMI